MKVATRQNSWGRTSKRVKRLFAYMLSLIHIYVEVLIAREDAAMGACRIAQARLKNAE